MIIINTWWWWWWSIFSDQITTIYEPFLFCKKKFKKFNFNTFCTHLHRRFAKLILKFKHFFKKRIFEWKKNTNKKNKNILIFFFHSFENVTKMFWHYPIFFRFVLPRELVLYVWKFFNKKLMKFLWQHFFRHYLSLTHIHTYKHNVNVYWMCCLRIIWIGNDWTTDFPQREFFFIHSCAMTSYCTMWKKMFFFCWRVKKRRKSFNSLFPFYSILILFYILWKLFFFSFNSWCNVFLLKKIMWKIEWIECKWGKKKI